MIHQPEALTPATLRPGHLYEATTLSGRDAIGEYLGIEVAYGEWAILLHTSHGVESLPIARIASVRPHLS